MAPISVRSNDEKGALGNQVSAMTVGIGTHVKDPLARLHFVHDSTDASKALTNAIGARHLADYSKFTPPMLTGLAARLYTRLHLANQMNQMFNTVITNVPGPQVPLYSVGARMVTQFGLGPAFDGVGIFHTVYSYCGQITVTAVACREMMPDPAFYAECLQEAFDELVAAAIQKPARMERPKKTQPRAPKDFEAPSIPVAASAAQA
jgi:hypothetical protein